MIIDLYIVDNYIDLLNKKELNFFIQDNNGNDMSDSLNDENILNIAIDSYYNILKEKQDSLTLDWEILCAKDMVDKLKTLNIKNNESIKFCKDKIKQVILKEKRSLPLFTNYDLKMRIHLKLPQN
jgi:hypothetical protein